MPAGVVLSGRRERRRTSNSPWLALALPLGQGGRLVDATALIFLAPLPVILIANWRRLAEHGSRAADWRREAGRLAWPLLGALGAGSFLLGLIEMTAAGAPGGGGRGPLEFGLVLGLSGVLVLGLVWRPFRVALSRVIPIDADNVLDAIALGFVVLLVGTQVGTQLTSDVLAQQARTGSALQPGDLLLQELPFLLAALLGVGLFVRRAPGSALRRLGLVRPAWWQLTGALAAAGLFYLFSAGVDQLAQWLTPALAQKVAAANQRLFGALGNPVGIATIALAAGICEEALFRGALQPRIGLLLTALVFAAVHTQYGLSLDALAVFILALGLGLVRKYANTTASMTCHVAYNAIAGVGVAGALRGPALGLEGLLIAVTLAHLFTSTVGKSPPSE